MSNTDTPSYVPYVMTPEESARIEAFRTQGQRQPIQAGEPCTLKGKSWPFVEQLVDPDSDQQPQVWVLKPGSEVSLLLYQRLDGDFSTFHTGNHFLEASGGERLDGNLVDAFVAADKAGVEARMALFEENLAAQKAGLPVETEMPADVGPRIVYYGSGSPRHVDPREPRADFSSSASVVPLRRGFIMAEAECPVKAASRSNRGRRFTATGS